MASRALLAGFLGILLPLGLSTARAQSHGLGHSAHHPGGKAGSPIGVPAAVAGAPLAHPGPPFFVVGIGPVGPFFFVPPLMAIGPGSIPPAAALPAPPQYDSGRLLAGPLPPKHLSGLDPAPGAPKPKAKRGDPARAVQLVTYGDRLFRAGNLKRATERYEQAVGADPHSAAPRVRLAQIALVRGQYAESARQLRQAHAAEPGWLVTAPDIEGIYAEPADFARQIARLESHVQTTPGDRDAWFVLGAQMFLSGRTRKAADIFLRLSDRNPDATLAAYLDASTPRDAQ